MTHQLVHDFGWWFFSSGQRIQGDHSFTGWWLCGLLSPRMSILFGNWLFVIGRDIIKYTLPLGLTYDLLSEDAKARVDLQTKTVHGLPVEPFLSDHNRHEFHPYHQLRDDVTRWCQQYLTPEQWLLGVFAVNGPYRLFQEPRFSYPIVVLEGQGCRELSSLPIATVNLMATNDHGRNWCHDYSHRERGIWHDGCARVRACQMSGWLRRHSNVLPTLSQVNAQRVLWQKRCDRLLDEILCNHCIDDKDDAFAQGKGLDWISDNCSE